MSRNIRDTRLPFASAAVEQQDRITGSHAHDMQGVVRLLAGKRRSMFIDSIVFYEESVNV